MCILRAPMGMCASPDVPRGMIPLSMVYIYVPKCENRMHAVQGQGVYLTPTHTLLLRPFCRAKCNCSKLLGETLEKKTVGAAFFQEGTKNKLHEGGKTPRGKKKFWLLRHYPIAWARNCIRVCTVAVCYSTSRPLMRFDHTSTKICDYTHKSVGALRMLRRGRAVFAESVYFTTLNSFPGASKVVVRPNTSTVTAKLET